METQHIREFVDLAKTCSFHETAERFFISASSLSKHISKIESELGVSLFDRTTRDVRLNEYGTVFFDYATRIDRDFSKGIAALKDVGANREYSITVGYWPRFEQFGILELLSRFADEHPYIVLDMVETEQPRLKLFNGACQFVFDFEPVKEEIVSHHFKTDHLVIIVSPDHAFAHEHVVNVSQLKDQSFIMKSDKLGRIEFNDFVNLCAQEGFEPKVVKSAHYSDTVVRLVSQGEGIAVLSRGFVPKALTAGVVILDLQPAISVSICVQHLRSRLLTIADEEFLNYVLHLQ